MTDLEERLDRHSRAWNARQPPPRSLDIDVLLASPPPDRRWKPYPSRRSGLISVVLVAASILAIVLVVPGSTRHVRVTTAPQPSRPTTTSPTARVVPTGHAPGSHPVDIGLLRLWLPAGWTFDAQAQGISVRGCWTRPARAVVAASTRLVACRTGALPPSILVAPLYGFVPGHLVEGRINGLSVWTVRRHIPEPPGVPELIDVPALHVSLTAFDATTVVDSLGPSAARIVLSAHYPVGIPPGWKRIVFDGFAAEVPPSWPTRIIRIVSTPHSVVIKNAPSLCGLHFGPRPAIYLGDSDAGILCNVAAPSMLVGRARPADGLWVQSATAVGFGGGARTGRMIPVVGGEIQLTPRTFDGQDTDVLDIQAFLNHRELEAVVGLGADPVTAEEVISSLTTA